MSIRVPSHLYRRSGTFYFRYIVPRHLQATAGRAEVRFSLGNEQRRAAIITALTLIADLPRLVGSLQRMAENDQIAPPDFFKKWQVEIIKNAGLRAEIAILKETIQEQEFQLAGMVPRSQAKGVAVQAHMQGQLKGKKELEAALVFPWPAERTALFSELLAAYLKSFTYRPKGGVRKPPGAKTLEGYRVDIEFFVKVMGDMRIGSIDREVTGQYFSVLSQLPPNISRLAKYRGLSIPEVLGLGDPPQSEYNASKKLERPSGMFKWALLEKRKWGIDSNSFVGFGQAGDNATKRRPFTHYELRALLMHPSYVTRTFTSAYSFWLILLAIFTGARLGELCQLDVKDFVTVEGIECVDINDIEATEAVEDGGRKKRVKTRSAKRLVPIHQELIRLGLLRYVQTLRERNQAHLFPELSRTRRDGPAQAASNWFQRFRARVGIITKQETVFHSFRHGFITNLLDADVTPHMVAPIVGHEGELITGKIYWNTKDATKRAPTVAAFVLPKEVLALMPSIEDIKFVAPGGPKVAQRVERR
ncbi:site-specific integrase [Rhodoferax sp. GW822-FHT02A01]|uniref:site-specific integrase n=1 Tax=Rhodoferax sp. GW822-FHT02A01 TaxID=3141537 RepID=UPI00315D4CC0